MKPLHLIVLSTLTCLSLPFAQGAQALTPQESAFLSAFRTMVSQQPQDIQNRLNLYLDRHSDLALFTAKNTCASLGFVGRSLADVAREQEQTSFVATPTDLARRQISNTLAVQYLCPNYAQRP